MLSAPKNSCSNFGLLNAQKMKVIIVGGGFAGLKLARQLNNKRQFEVTLLDKYNYHQFQPLFYQVATAGLDASNISSRFARHFTTVKMYAYALANCRK